MAILGIDIGGTKSTVGVYANDRLQIKKLIESRFHPGPTEYLNAIIETACLALKTAGGPSVSGVGIGCGGPLDRKTGTILVVPNLPGWENLPLVRIFGDAFDAPAYLDNDQTLGALAELTFGAGRGVENFVYLGVSTGIGGGIVIGGKIYRGSGDNAGEFGHHKILAEGPRCPCGDHGCLESLASGRSIARRAKEAALELKPAERPSWAAEVDEITAAMVAQEAAGGELLASRVWLESMTYLGIGVANIINIFNPEMVILGGGVTKAGDLLFEPVRRVAMERAMPALAKIVRIVPSALGDDAGVLGAIALAMEQERA